MGRPVYNQEALERQAEQVEAAQQAAAKHLANGEKAMARWLLRIALGRQETLEWMRTKAG